MKSTGSPRRASIITRSWRCGPTRKPSMPTKPPPIRCNSGPPRRRAGRPGGPTSTTSACTELCDRRVDHRDRQDALDKRVVARQGTRERRVQPGRLTRSSRSLRASGNGGGDMNRARHPVRGSAATLSGTLLVHPAPRRPRRSGRGANEAGRRDALGALRDHGPGLVRSGRGDGLHHAVLDPVRAARRAREADARQPHGAQPGRVVDGERGPARLRVQAARGSQIP